MTLGTWEVILENITPAKAQLIIGLNKFEILELKID